MPLDVVTSERNPNPEPRNAELEKEIACYKKVAGDVIKQKHHRIAELEQQIDEKNIEAASGPRQPVAIYASLIGKYEPPTDTPSKKRFQPKEKSPVKSKKTRQLGCRLK